MRSVPIQNPHTIWLLWVCTRYNSKRNINHHFLEWFLSKGGKEHQNTATATVPTVIRLPFKAIFISYKGKGSVKQTLAYLVDYNDFWSTNIHIFRDQDKMILAILHFLLWGPGESDHPVLKTLKTNQANPPNPPFLVLIRERVPEPSQWQLSHSSPSLLRHFSYWEECLGQCIIPNSPSCVNPECYT